MRTGQERRPARCAPAETRSPPHRIRIGGNCELAQIESWLDYAVDLGVSGVLLGPVFESSSHGYDTIDYYRVDSRLGTDADLERLLAALQGHNMQVLFDGVFNHALRGSHPWLHTARTHIVKSHSEQDLLYESVNADGSLFVALNVSDSPMSYDLGRATRILESSPGAALAGSWLSVAAHGWAIQQTL